MSYCGRIAAFSYCVAIRTFSVRLLCSFNLKSLRCDPQLQLRFVKAASLVGTSGLILPLRSGLFGLTTEANLIFQYCRPQ